MNYVKYTTYKQHPASTYEGNTGQMKWFIKYLSDVLVIWRTENDRSIHLMGRKSYTLHFSLQRRVESLNDAFSLSIMDIHLNVVWLSHAIFQFLSLSFSLFSFEMYTFTHLYSSDRMIYRLDFYDHFLSYMHI